MKSNDIFSSLDIIKRDLVETKEQLIEAAFSGHKLLVDQACEVGNLSLATLLFTAASLGDYQSTELRPVAVGIELLQMAVEKHYYTKANDAIARNLFLVTADYFYAKAISLAARLKKGFVIEHMVKAIANIAAVESSRDGNTAYDDKNVSLFETAASLGIRLGGCPSNLADTLAGFASLLGRASQDKERMSNTLKIFPMEQGLLLESLIVI